MLLTRYPRFILNYPFNYYFMKKVHIGRIEQGKGIQTQSEIFFTSSLPVAADELSY